MHKLLAPLIPLVLFLHLSCATYPNPGVASPTTAPEPTTFYVCWHDDDGIDRAAYYNGPEAICGLDGSTPQELVWNRGQFPLHVWIDPSLPDMHKTQLRTALKLWNGWLGTEIFKEAKILNEVIVVSHIDGAVIGAKIILASTSHVRVGSKMGSVIKVKALLVEDNETKVLKTYAHELGHVLGLNHDPEAPHSLMAPYLTDVVECLTKADLSALTGKYGKNQAKGLQPPPLDLCPG